MILKPDLSQFDDVTDEFSDSYNVDCDMNNYPILYTPPSSEEDSKPAFCGNWEEISVSPEFLPVQFLNNDENQPHLRIKEQPIDRFRFRYKSEMAGTHGSLTGRSTDRIKTYPTVELCNYNKTAIIRCMLSQIDAENDPDNVMPHAHRLIKKVGTEEKDDPHECIVSPEFGYVASFHSMGIVHTAKKNIVAELVRKKTQLKKEEIARREGQYRDLKLYEDIEIKGLAEAESKSINLNIVCLRFDAYERTVNGILKQICPPIFSYSINNLKSALTGELKIVRMDHCSSPSVGNREIFILVEKVTKKNIKIRFFQIDDDENEIWEDYGRFNDLDVHHQYAIVFKTPPYKDRNITEKVKVFIELVRPSDSAKSEPKEFIYTPSEIVGNKRLRTSSYNTSGYSSSFSSGDLPEPITNFAQTFENLSVGSNLVNSEELNRALENVNSDEFEKLMQSHGYDYLRQFCTDSPNKKIQSTRQQRLVSQRESDALIRIFKEFQSILCADKKDKKYVKDLINVYFGRGKSNELPYNKTSPLFLAIRVDSSEMVAFFIHLFLKFDMKHLINTVNSKQETALHIAVKLTNKFEIVKSLLSLNPDLSLKDCCGNTPLHVATLHEKGVFIYHLLNVPNVEEFINEENNDGDTALQIAIDNEQVKLVKFLCEKKADVNKRHKKDGSTSLHSAIRKQNLEIVEYLLKNTNIDTQALDYSGSKPIKTALALMRDDSKISCDIYNIIKTHMQEKGQTMDVVVKNEIEEDSSDDEMEIRDDMKKENLTPEELKTMYNNISLSSVEWKNCLKRISRMLDETHSWQHLAELLDLGHILKTDLFKKSSPSEALLHYATSMGEPIYDIRNFLENLNELDAVRELDLLVLG